MHRKPNQALVYSLVRLIFFENVCFIHLFVEFPVDVVDVALDEAWALLTPTVAPAPPPLLACTGGRVSERR